MKITEADSRSSKTIILLKIEAGSKQGPHQSIVSYCPRIHWQKFGQESAA
jgi:hypothetical protein